jgi:2'-5' RNA ligase
LSVRLFVAVWPDASTMRELSALDLRRTPGLRPVSPEHWHITLRFLGDVSDDVVPALIDALMEVAQKTEPVHCAVGPLTAWFNRGRVLQVPVAGLDRTAGAVRAATASLVASEDPPFVGHLTLGRARRELDDTTRDALAGVPCTAAFTVDSFALVISHLSRGGPRYTTLARFGVG